MKKRKSLMLLSTLFVLPILVLSSCSETSSNTSTAPSTSTSSNPSFSSSPNSSSSSSVEEESGYRLLAPSATSKDDLFTSLKFDIKDGLVSYEATYGGEVISSASQLGLRLTGSNYSESLVLEGEPELTSGADVYDLYGKKSHVDAAYNQMTLKFSSELYKDYYLIVEARAYDEGVGVRLGLEKRNSDAPIDILIEDEDFAYTMPDGATYIAQDTNGNSSTSSEYAWNFYENDLNDTQSLEGQYNFPFMYDLHGDEKTYVLYSEANVMTGKFHASVLDRNGSDLTVSFCPEAAFHSYWQWDYENNQWVWVSDPIDSRVEAQVTAEESFYAPWRFITVGDLDTIANQTMSENLSDPMDETLFVDDSYIQPGKSVWTWLNGDLRHDQIPSNQFETMGYEIYKNYIDFAAENGWEYQLMDEGWQIILGKIPESERSQYPGYDPDAVEEDSRQYLGYYSWTKDIIEYANSKGVKLLVWCPYNDIGTEKERERLAYWKELGFAGIKPDFFDSGSQDVLKVAYEATKECAELGLLIDLHGISKPAGERRTFPNALTREAVGGAEGYAGQNMSAGSAWVWDNEKGEWVMGDPSTSNFTVGPNQDTILPFVRYAVGPGDYTPTASFGAPLGDVSTEYGNMSSPSSWTRYSSSSHDNPPLFSLAHLYAQSLVFESPINILADKPFAYQANESVYENYFRVLPTVFDESKVLDGSKVGSLASIARRSGTDWYVGVVSSYDHFEVNADYVDYTVDLSQILDEGATYKAYIYSDTEDAEVLKTSLSQANMFTPSEYIKGLYVRELDVTSEDSISVKLSSVNTPVFTYSDGTSSSRLTTCGGAVMRFVKVS